jgi:hypothetical protein
LKFSLKSDRFASTFRGFTLADRSRRASIPSKSASPDRFGYNAGIRKQTTKAGIANFLFA